MEGSPARRPGGSGDEETTQAALVGYGRSPIGERAEAVRRLDLDLAAENLLLAVALGFRDPARLRKNRDAWLLLDRPGVRPLSDDIVFPENPFESAPGPK